MWITTQNKGMLINSEQIIDIYTNVPGTIIFAETNAMINGVNKIIPLGEYKDRETCLLVLDELSGAMKMKCIVYDMPTQEVIDDGYFSSNCQA